MYELYKKNIGSNFFLLINRVTERYSMNASIQVSTDFITINVEPALLTKMQQQRRKKKTNFQYDGHLPNKSIAQKKKTIRKGNAF